MSESVNLRFMLMRCHRCSHPVSGLSWNAVVFGLLEHALRAGDDCAAAVEAELTAILDGDVTILAIGTTDPKPAR